MKNKFFIAMDGDSVGVKLENFVILGDLNSLKDYSQKIDKTIKKIKDISRKVNGSIYLSGGDNLLIEVTNIDEFIQEFLSIKKELECTFSIGIGKNCIEAYLALKIAKTKKPDKIILAKNHNSKVVFEDYKQNILVEEELK